MLPYFREMQENVKCALMHCGAWLRPLGKETHMHYCLKSGLSAALIMAALPSADVFATTRDQAESMCSKNKKCEPILRGDDGAIYCVRQPNGTCTVVVCPTTKDCYVWRTAPAGGALTSTVTAGRELLRRGGSPRGRTSGVGQLLLGAGQPSVKALPKSGAMRDSLPEAVLTQPKHGIAKGQLSP